MPMVTVVVSMVNIGSNEFKIDCLPFSTFACKYLQTKADITQFKTDNFLTLVDPHQVELKTS